MNNDLISRSSLLEQVQFRAPVDTQNAEVIDSCVKITRRLIKEAPAVDAVDAVALPCKIGDTAWMIRRHNSGRRLACGAIRELYFSEDMELCAVIYNAGRGIIGKTVFLTEEDAREALQAWNRRASE